MSIQGRLDTFTPTAGTRFETDEPRTPSGAGQQPPIFVAADRVIYAPGDPAGGIYTVEFGGVRVYRLLTDGRRQISAFHLPGEIFGLEAGDTHRCFAEAMCATGLRIACRRSVRKELEAKLLPMALTSLTQAQQHLLVLGRQNSMERVAAFLLELFERQGGLPQIELPMSRMDIADYLGLTIETVSRVFSKLKQNQVIRLRNSRRVEIVRMAALCDMAS